MALAQGESLRELPNPAGWINGFSVQGAGPGRTAGVPATYFITYCTSFEDAALDAKLNRSYILFGSEFYIGLKPRVNVDRKPVSGLVYPYITFFAERETVLFNG